MMYQHYDSWYLGEGFTLHGGYEQGRVVHYLTKPDGYTGLVAIDETTDDVIAYFSRWLQNRKQADTWVAAGLLALGIYTS